ncbi:MAG TPA: hypothetical protein VF529_21880 [Solirubrobacteraceae bacterium]|jgi:hypothetical protein
MAGDDQRFEGLPPSLQQRGQVHPLEQLRILLAVSSFRPLEKSQLKKTMNRSSRVS